MWLIRKNNNQQFEAFSTRLFKDMNFGLNNDNSNDNINNNDNNNNVINNSKDGQQRVQQQNQGPML